MNETAAYGATQDSVSTETALRCEGYVMPRPHCHDYFELFYAESGTCRFFIQDTMYDIRSGDFMLIPPEIFHYTRYLSGPCRRSVVRFRRTDLDGSVIRLLPQGEDFFSAARILHTPEEFRGQMNAHLSRMVSEQKIGGECSRPCCGSCCRSCSYSAAGSAACSAASPTRSTPQTDH